MRMYGAALFSAAMARVWSERFNIFSFPCSASEQLVEHRHLHDEAVVRFTLHDAARAVEHFIGHRGIATDRQAMHEPAVGRGGGEPVILHAPVGEIRAQ